MFHLITLTHWKRPTLRGKALSHFFMACTFLSNAAVSQAKEPRWSVHLMLTVPPPYLGTGTKWAPQTALLFRHKPMAQGSTEDGLSTCLFGSHMHTIQRTLETPEHMIYPFSLPSPLDLRNQRPHRKSQAHKNRKNHDVQTHSFELRTYSPCAYHTPSPKLTLTASVSLSEEAEHLHKYIFLQGYSEITICKALSKLEAIHKY